MKLKSKNTAREMCGFRLLGLFVLSLHLAGCNNMKLANNDAIQAAIAEFDERNGKGSHRKYTILVREHPAKWTVYFDAKAVALPGDHYVVFVYKNDRKVEYFSGE